MLGGEERVSEDGGAHLALGSLAAHFAEMRAVEDVVVKNEREAAADEVVFDVEGLGRPLGAACSP
jgi:hypothetical protein